VQYLLKGAIIGFSIAAPVGPIGLLCIRRTLAGGRISGLVTGLGAATADAAYGFVAAFGLTYVSSFLVTQQGWLQLIGGGFLVYLGITIFRSTVASKEASAKASGLLGQYASTVFLTLTNPTTILSFVAIFAGLGIGSETKDYASASAMVLGVFLGSALWWLILSEGMHRLRDKASLKHLNWANKTSGAVILLLGIWAILRSISVF
jgi:threonine/homoserine/homoserine lactone efflux protein